MARSIKEIANRMKAKFVGNENLRTAYAPELDDFDTNADDDGRAAYYDAHFSAVSVETCLIYIVATCANALEHMMDWFKEDVDEIVANERYGHKGWYEKVARQFTFGNPAEQIVSQVSVEELEFGIKMKVAKGEPGALRPLETDPLATDPDGELGAFIFYMNRQKPAGIPIRFVNQDADELSLVMTVYYDPVKVEASEVEGTVKENITAYLQGIDFNGVFTTMGLVDYLQGVEGLSIIEVNDAYAKPVGENEHQIENATRDVPVSGWYELDEENTEITAVPLL